jgi:hypothetical protein
MCRRIRVLAVPFALLLTPMAHTAAVAQEYIFSGGAVEGTQVRTNRNPVAIGEGAYVKLGSSELTVQLAPGDSDLFVYEFDAQCHIPGAGWDDSIAVEARLFDAIGLFGSSFLQPQDFPHADLRFCGNNAARQSMSKTWAIRLTNSSASAVNYRFSIYVWAVDGANDDANLTGWLDDRTVKITRYN